MKTQTEMNYTDAAMECARYIFDSDSEQTSYQEYVVDGNDPREHILYCAAVVLGETEDFQTDIDEYLQTEND
ncbi:hypothetical protein EB118_07945 [bacterium]|nr:hypothetical protein [bacterium]NDC95918.1 hypothetical protein [bacterium]NDD85483.1 hypothetical protein [bacterium]NDG30010.1 hypothetical protein [bacterium]